jgi:hypothetical protein
MTYFVAADIAHRKVNLELPLPSARGGPQSLQEIIRAIEDVFQNEACALLAALQIPVPLFSVASLQIFNERSLSWEPLQYPQQIMDRSQMYVVQADPNHEESQEQIPLPRKPSPRVTTAESRPLSPTFARPRASAPQLPAAAPATDLLQDQAPSTVWRIPSGQGSTPAALPAALPAGWFRQPHFTASGSASPATDAAAVARAASPPRQRALVSSADVGPAPHRSVQIDSFRENATIDEKVRLIFYFLEKGTLPASLVTCFGGVGPAARVDAERFATMFRSLKLGVTPEIISEIFRRADLDNDGLLSLPEVQQLAMNYPTLTDSLFFRLVDGYEYSTMQQQLSQDLAALSELTNAHRDVSSQVTVVSKELADQRTALQRLEAEQMRRSLQERELRQFQEQEASGIASEERDVKQMLAQLSRMRQDLQAQQQQGSKTDAEVDKARQAQRETQHKIAACESNISRIRQMLRDAEAELDQLHAVASSQEADAARLLEAAQAGARQGDTLRLFIEQGEAQAAEASERAAQKRNDQTIRAQELSKFAAETLQHQTKMMEMTRALDQLQERHQRAIAEDQAAAANVSRQQLCVSSREAQLLHLTQRRAALEQRERPLLEQEILIKQQRALLEQNEQKLRQDAGCLYDSTRTASRQQTPMAGSGSPTPAQHKTVSPARRTHRQ